MATRRTWMSVPLAAALVASAPAPAATVHKCRRPDGSVAYQGAACARGEITLAAWEAAPDPEPVVQHTRRVARPAAPRIARAAPRTRRAARGEAGVDPCRAARERRDSVERQVGLARTYELLSALQREVFDACR